MSKQLLVLCKVSEILSTEIDATYVASVFIGLVLGSWGKIRISIIFGPEKANLQN
jgi:hypothetical protein